MKRSTDGLMFGIVMTALTLALPLTLWAQVNSYTNAGAGAWDAAANWSTGVAPSNNDSVFITNGASTVSLTNTTAATWMTVSNLTVSGAGAGANLLVNFADQSQTLTVGSGTAYGTLALGASSGQSGILTVSNGNFSALTAILGSGTGSTGIWNIVSGTNSIRTTAGGYGLNIGGTALGAGGVGVVQVDGGFLNAANSGVMVGTATGGSGTLTVNNGTVSSLALRVGDRGTGTLNMFGGTNTTSILTLGRYGGTSGTMLMTNGYVQASSLEIGSRSFLAGVAQGLLTMSNGTLVSSTVYLGQNTNAVGAWNISGGTSTVATAVYVGNAGGSTGSISLAGGALVVTNTSGTAQLVVGASGVGAFTLSGGSLVVDQLFVTNGSSSTFAASGGSLAARAATIGSSFSLTNSTASFSSNLTVTASGALSGTNGLFILSRNFINQSTNRSQFDLSRSTLLFTSNGPGISTHTLNLTNSGAVDMGSNWLNVAQLATNFSIGTLSISLSNQVTLTGTKSGLTTNALYVGWLDLTAWNTNAASLNGTLQAALALPDINLYYDASDTRNAYLQDASYNLWGGGLLIPIPEPGMVWSLVLGGGLLLWRKRRWER